MQIRIKEKTLHVRKDNTSWNFGAKDAEKLHQHKGKGESKGKGKGKGIDLSPGARPAQKPKSDQMRFEDFIGKVVTN